MGLLKSINFSGSLVTVTLLASCSSHIPLEIKQPLDGGPGVAQVHHKIDDYLTQKVRWGGLILQTKNKHNTTEITVMALPLNDDGEPQSSDQSPGRFIAIIDEFLEPLVYSPEREITVTGHILKTETIEVGEFPYEYPVILVDHYYLWPPEQERQYDDYPYNTWMYGPYHPWYYPYYYPHHRHK